MLTKIVSVFFLGVIANGAVAFASPGACVIAAAKLCYESATIDISADCVANGGTLSQVCSTSDRYGSCVVSQEGQTMTLRYYNGTPIEPEENCAENGGQFTRN